MIHSIKRAALVLLIFVVAACSAPPENAADVKPVDQLGNWRLGHLIVKADDALLGPLSRKASEEELETSLRNAFAPRIANQNGEKFYHISLVIGAYVLAQPGIPLLLSPKSALIIDVILFDDATQEKILEEPKRFTVLEHLSAESIIGSGLTKTRETQLEEMSQIAAKQIADWLADNPQLFES